MVRFNSYLYVPYTSMQDTFLHLFCNMQQNQMLEIVNKQQQRVCLLVDCLQTFCSSSETCQNMAARSFCI